MDLTSGLPFWLIKDGLPHSYAKLDKDIETDVLVVGAGISGALVRYHLINAGIDCVTIDARTIGLGSTCASTSLLQYEIDVPLSELTTIIGKNDAERCFHLCNDAITKLEKIAKKLKLEEFESKDSLYFAARKKDVPFLKAEFEARKLAGFDVTYLDEKQIEAEYKFSSPGAILSKHGAETNAYAFAHALLQYKCKSAPIFDRSPIVKAEHQKNGSVLQTEDGFKIKARKIIYATGYEAASMIDKKIVKLLSTYATISEQYDTDSFWKNDLLIWNTADPYLYLRSTPDGRILIGGRDEEFYDPKQRDKLIGRKAKMLAADFKKLFPKIEFKSEFSWTGTFGSTKDGLPYIGAYEKIPNSYFALGFGGNGITFSLIAAEILTDVVCGKTNKDAGLFSFDR